MVDNITFDEIRRALREIPLWTHTAVCNPVDEARLLHDLPNDVRVRTNGYVPAGRVYLIDDEALDEQMTALRVSLMARPLVDVEERVGLLDLRLVLGGILDLAGG